ncbi:restriction endonuclease subunit S [Pseudomonas aeruginosa]|uniref:restriction endonuclease subunit S n=1 Tax=Pseudomonas aeruginosa TaxID=287 RepID=UPI0015E78968|nr:restriction endonuclease subunit S [Pseudomonas aeruginosa]
MFNRVSAEKLQSRLDADFYKKEFIANDELLKASGAVRLNSLIDVTKSNYGVLPKSEEYVTSGVPLIRGGDLSFGKVNPPEVHAPTSYAGGKGAAEEGDILVLIKGACIDGPEGVARVGESEKGFIFNGSCYRLAFKDRDVDGYFFIAYSQARQFLMQKKRQVANTGISYNDEDSILGYWVPNLHQITRRYIGDKVRQAERLREGGKLVHSRVLDKFESLLGCYDKQSKSFERVSPDLLEDRLDQNHYKTSLLSCFKLLQSKKHVSLADKKYFTGLTDGDHGNPKYGMGPIYLRASEMKEGLISIDSVARVDPEYAKGVSISCWAKADDIIFSVVGTLGLTAIVDSRTSGLMSRGVAKVFSNILPGYYVKAFFKTHYFQAQLERHSVGSVQRGVYLSALEKIIVPIFDQSILDEIAEGERLADDMVKSATQLTNAAKLLVEALIEGQLTEAELLTAEKALQAGNDRLDRVILSRLNTDGIDGQGPALFGDLDELYQLLSLAEGE